MGQAICLTASLCSSGESIASITAAVMATKPMFLSKTSAMSGDADEGDEGEHLVAAYAGRLGRRWRSRCRARGPGRSAPPPCTVGDGAAVLVLVRVDPPAHQLAAAEDEEEDHPSDRVHDEAAEEDVDLGCRADRLSPSPSW